MIGILPVTGGASKPLPLAVTAGADTTGRSIDVPRPVSADLVPVPVRTRELRNHVGSCRKRTLRVLFRKARMSTDIPEVLKVLIVEDEMIPRMRAVDIAEDAGTPNSD